MPLGLVCSIQILNSRLEAKGLSLHTGYYRHARVLTERLRQITVSIPTSRLNETRWGVLARFIEDGVVWARVIGTRTL